MQRPAGRGRSYASRLARRLRDVSTGFRLLWLVGAIALVAYPLLLLFARSFAQPDGTFGLHHYRLGLADPDMVQATINSLWVATGTTVGCVLLGVPFAYVLSRTDIPAKRTIRSLTVLTFAAPSFIAALGWMLLLGPRAGILNGVLQNLFGLEEPPFNIFSPWGIIFALTLFFYPLVLLPAAAALDNMDASLEQAASSLGAGRATIIGRITLPLIAPAIIAGSMLVFVNAFVIFGPVAILGSPVGFDTVPTLMLRLMRLPPPRIELAAVLGVPVLVVLGLLIYVQKRLIGERGFALIGGRTGYRAVHRLGRWRWVASVGSLLIMVVSLGLPFGILVLTSVRRSIGRPFGPENFVLADNFVRLLRQPLALPAFTNSLLLAVSAVIAVIAFSFVAAWLVERDRSWLSPVVSPTMLSPLAFPGAILGIALVIAYARPPFRLAGGLLILLFAYVLRAMPFAYPYIRSGLTQIGSEVEDAARSLGASWTHTFRRITLPLIKGSVLSVALLNFVLLFRELETSIFLFTGRNAVVSVVLLNFALEARFQLMAAFSVVVLALNFVVVVIALRLFRSAFR